ncbi:thiamine pyrophosphate-binding protein [Chondromyces apiculatus]|uniref:Thiamine pyrophosphate-requiring enzyme n=1 Tax=Chondromyces apiculatus DSM 436 TaxID=1192034 RepID=A0A017TBC7_9BACT|nr:thiamine pyrophosphate-binding protein [Chondromyces apiculatus]EYF06568.1 Thiamine pyrophosphate-requiring enzyme [Chondromyces apiculatus DSM 436]
MAQVHGGRLVSKALARHGVTHLFTLCGGHIQAIYDGCLDDGIRVVDVRHEQTAGHAADGYARVTGRPGVCAVTAGPGVTDVVTAMANAQRAGIPMLVIGGAGPRLLADMGSLQDMNHVELMRPITKWSVSVPSTERIQEYIDSAFRIAQSNVPGPVFLEMPLDLLMSYADDAPTATAPTGEGGIVPSRPGGDPAAIKRAAALLQEAERPMFIVGTQLRWSPQRDILTPFAEAIEAPYYVNGMARGALPHAHPRLMSRSRRFALGQADLCVVLGTPFDFRLEYGRAINPGAKVVQVDLDGSEVGRNRRVDVAIHGDSGVVLEQLLAEVPEKRAEAWLASVRAAEDKSRAKMLAEIDSNDSPPNPLRVCAEVGKRLGREDIVIGDGGDFVATAAYVLKMEWPQIWMDPGPLGTLGVGPGYAMAAKLARPGSRVVIMYGDGSFGLHALEFEAMVRQDIPVVAIIGNDAAWMQIRRGQVDLYGEARAPATTLAYTRYEKVVEAVGGFGAWVERVEDLGPALDEAFSCGRPACVNVKIARSDFRKGAISV